MAARPTMQAAQVFGQRALRERRRAEDFQLWPGVVGGGRERPGVSRHDGERVPVAEALVGHVRGEPALQLQRLALADAVLESGGYLAFNHSR